MLGELTAEANCGAVLAKGALNGVDAQLLLDSGATLSSIAAGDAERVNMAARMRRGLETYGVGGSRDTKVSTVDIGFGRTTIKSEAIIVLQGPATDGPPMAIIGRDLLMQHDLEFDLEHNAIRILDPEECAAPELVYWNKPYSQAKLEGDGGANSAILVDVLLNGHVIPAMIDSGASVSVVTPEAAAVAGVPIDTGDTAGNLHGIGAHTLGAKAANFRTFTIGDESIQNIRIRIADLWKYNKIEETGTRLGYNTTVVTPKMLIGADFLRAHRVFIAHKQGLILFSYIGGPIFDAPPEPKPQVAPTAQAKH